MLLVHMPSVWMYAIANAIKIAKIVSRIRVSVDIGLASKATSSGPVVLLCELELQEFFT